MSRSGYSEDGEQWDMIRWRGAVKSAIRGKRGQAFFVELLTALDAMPEKRLISEDLVCERGEVCTLGAVGRARGLEMGKLDPEEHESLGKTFGIARALVCEIEYMNDEYMFGSETPEARWARMRAWVAGQIRAESAKL